MRPKAEIWRPIFLQRLRETGNVSLSADAAGIDRSTAYKAYEASQDFAAGWDAAKEEAIERLEGEAWRRAYEGVAEPVFYQGDEVGTVKRYSDTLMIFLLKAHAPEKYRDRSSIEMSGPNGGPIEKVMIYIPDNGRNADEEGEATEGTADGVSFVTG